MLMSAFWNRPPTNSLSARVLSCPLVGNLFSYILLCFVLGGVVGWAVAGRGRRRTFSVERILYPPFHWCYFESFCVDRNRRLLIRIFFLSSKLDMAVRA